MNEMEEGGDIYKQIEPQQWIYIAVNRALQLRQTSPKKFRDGAAGAWVSLFPQLLEDLSNKIGDGKRNEKYFDELLKEVQEIDLKDEFTEKTPEEKKTIRSCEYIINKIKEVLEENGLLYQKRNRPSFGLRKRSEGGD